MNAATISVGDVIDLPTHPLTASQHVRGSGTVTVVKVTDPLNHLALVIVTYGAGVIHLQDVRL